MSSEKANYRITLEDILHFSKQRRLLNVKNVMDYTGKTRAWCVKHIPFTDGHITAVALARHLS